jgi:hypothetical protein
VAPVDERNDRLGPAAARCRPIRQSFAATLQRVVLVGCERGEQSLWAKTVGTCRQLMPRRDDLWSFLEIQVSNPPTTRLSMRCASP